MLGRGDILRNVNAVIDDHVGHQLSNQRNQLFGLPLFFSLSATKLHPRGVVFLSGIGIVKPKNVNFSVVCQKLGNLISHVFVILLHISAAILLFSIGIVTTGMDLVDRKFGVMPVNHRIIETNLQSFGTERVQKLAHDILAVGRVHYVVIGIFGIKQTKSLVVLGRQHRVFHTRRLCFSCPLAGIVKIGIEMIEIALIFLLGNKFRRFAPFVARTKRIQSEMNKHAKAVMHEPFGIPGRFLSYVRAHEILL